MVKPYAQYGRYTDAQNGMAILSANTKKRGELKIKWRNGKHSHRYLRLTRSLLVFKNKEKHIEFQYNIKLVYFENLHTVLSIF